MSKATSKTITISELGAMLEELGFTIVADDAKAATKAATKAKAKCGRIASSTGEPCTRNATTEEGSCKSHIGWDNDEALAKFAKSQEFVADRRKAAAKKGKGPKVDNRALAPAMRAVGVTPNGEPWEAAKALVAKGASIEDAALKVATALKAAK